MRKLALEIAIAAALTVAAILSLAASARANDILITGAYAGLSIARGQSRLGLFHSRQSRRRLRPDRRGIIGYGGERHDS